LVVVVVIQLILHPILEHNLAVQVVVVVVMLLVQEQLIKVLLVVMVQEQTKQVLMFLVVVVGQVLWVTHGVLTLQLRHLH
tara:strand:- start:299 stop:538 length:240 start_codon:yes stop_codon:yes gene_type:complete